MYNAKYACSYCIEFAKKKKTPIMILQLLKLFDASIGFVWNYNIIIAQRKYTCIQKFCFDWQLIGAVSEAATLGETNL